MPANNTVSLYAVIWGVIIGLMGLMLSALMDIRADLAAQQMFDRKAIVEQLIHYRDHNNRFHRLNTLKSKLGDSAADQKKRLQLEHQLRQLRKEYKPPSFSFRKSVINACKDNPSDEGALLILGYVVSRTSHFAKLATDEETINNHARWLNRDYQGAEAYIRNLNKDRPFTREQMAIIRKQAFDLLLQHHVKRKDLWQALQGFLSDPLAFDEALSFARSVVANSPHREVRGRFALAIAQDRDYKARRPDTPRHQIPALENEARKYAHMVVEQYADIPADTRIARAYFKSSLGEQATAILALATGRKAPDIEAANLQGGMDRLSNYRGKVVLVDFWATWCRPCVQQLPEIHAFRQEMAGLPFEVISISVDDDAEDVLEFQQVTAMPWVNWHTGPRHPILIDWTVVTFPAYFLIDAEGTLHSKLKFGDEVKALARKLVAQTAKVEQ